MFLVRAKPHPTPHADPSCKAEELITGSTVRSGWKVAESDDSSSWAYSPLKSHLCSPLMLLTSLLVLWDVQGASSHHQKANSAAREDSRPPAETDPDFSGAHLPEASTRVSIYDSLCSDAVKNFPKLSPCWNLEFGDLSLCSRGMAIIFRFGRNHLLEMRTVFGG